MSKNQTTAFIGYTRSQLIPQLPMRDIRIFDTYEELYTEAAGIFLQAGTEAIINQGRFSIGLSGGSTPLPLYRLLAQAKTTGPLDWHKSHFFWGDERPVGPDHSQSNFREAFQSLLSPLDIPPQNIHRIQGEHQPDLAAREYEKDLLTWFGNVPPRFDLILLGMGDDGHTASLFPGTTLVKKALAGQTGWTEEVYVPQLDSWRISMTPRLINAASLILFLVTGRNKASTLKQVLDGPHRPEIYPAQLIQPIDGKQIWLLDGEAAAGMCT